LVLSLVSLFCFVLLPTILVLRSSIAKMNKKKINVGDIVIMSGLVGLSLALIKTTFPILFNRFIAQIVELPCLPIHTESTGTK